jgi:hypothetical protein
MSNGFSCFLISRSSYYLGRPHHTHTHTSRLVIPIIHHSLFSTSLTLTFPTLASLFNSNNNNQFSATLLRSASPFSQINSNFPLLQRNKTKNKKDDQGSDFRDSRLKAPSPLIKEVCSQSQRRFNCSSCWILLPDEQILLFFLFGLILQTLVTVAMDSPSF